MYDRLKKKKYNIKHSQVIIYHLMNLFDQIMFTKINTLTQL